jgi:hypothetical protein
VRQVKIEKQDFRYVANSRVECKNMRQGVAGSGVGPE